LEAPDKSYAWFENPAHDAHYDGLRITQDEDGNTLLTGPVVDDAALHGLLKKVRDLGMSLLSVNRVSPDQSDAEDKIKDNKEEDTK
jgi:hypothetical protein